MPNYSASELKDYVNFYIGLIVFACHCATGGLWANGYLEKLQDIKHRTMHQPVWSQREGNCEHDHLSIGKAAERNRLDVQWSIAMGMTRMAAFFLVWPQLGPPWKVKQKRSFKFSSFARATSLLWALEIKSQLNHNSFKSAVIMAISQVCFGRGIYSNWSAMSYCVIGIWDCFVINSHSSSLELCITMHQSVLGLNSSCQIQLLNRNSCIIYI